MFKVVFEFLQVGGCKVPTLACERCGCNGVATDMGKGCTSVGDVWEGTCARERRVGGDSAVEEVVVARRCAYCFM